MLSDMLQSTFQQKEYCLTWSFAQVKALCNVVREALSNIVSEKILCNVVLILVKHHGTGQKLMQCRPTDFRQPSKTKILFNIALILLGQHPVQYFHNTPGAVLHRKSSMGFRFRGSKQFKNKNSVHCSLNTTRTTLGKSKIYAILCECLQSTLHKKKSYSMLS